MLSHNSAKVSTFEASWPRSKVRKTEKIFLKMANMPKKSENEAWFWSEHFFLRGCLASGSDIYAINLQSKCEVRFLWIATRTPRGLRKVKIFSQVLTRCFLGRILKSCKIVEFWVQVLLDGKSWGALDCVTGPNDDPEASLERISLIDGPAAEIWGGHKHDFQLSRS